MKELNRSLLAVPELVSLSVVVQTVKRHLKDLVGLTQTVPGSVVALVHFNGVSEFNSQQQKPHSTARRRAVFSKHTVQHLEPDLYAWMAADVFLISMYS